MSDLMHYHDPSMAGKSRYFQMGRIPVEVRYDDWGNAQVNAYHPVSPELQHSLIYIGEFNRSDGDELTREEYEAALEKARTYFTPETIAHHQGQLAVMRAMADEEKT